MDLEPGAIHLVTEPKPELSYRLLAFVMRKEFPALVISRTHPDLLRRRRDLADVPILWLAETPGERHVSPKAIASLAKAVERFVDAHDGRAVVLLDGIEFLVTNNGFEPVLTLLEHLNDFVMPRKALLIVPVSPAAFEPIQLARLERYVDVADVGMWNAHLDAQDWSRRLDGG